MKFLAVPVVFVLFFGGLFWLSIKEEHGYIHADTVNAQCHRHNGIYSVSFHDERYVVIIKCKDGFIKVIE